MDESEGRPIWFINRDTLVVRPLEPFVRWAESVHDGGKVDPEITRTWVNSFLIPEFDLEEESWTWIRENCGVIFEIMLNDWLMDPDQWPEDRGWAEFEKWFSHERIEVAWDLVDEPLSSEPPTEEEGEEPVWDA